MKFAAHCKSVFTAVMKRVDEVEEQTTASQELKEQKEQKATGQGAGQALPAPDLEALRAQLSREVATFEDQRAALQEASLQAADLLLLCEQMAAGLQGEGA